MSDGPSLKESPRWGSPQAPLGFQAAILERAVAGLNHELAPKFRGDKSFSVGGSGGSESGAHASVVCLSSRHGNAGRKSYAGGSFEHIRIIVFLLPNRLPLMGRFAGRTRQDRARWWGRAVAIGALALVSSIWTPE